MPLVFSVTFSVIIQPSETLGNLLNNVCCENKNINNKFLNKRYFATYVAFSSSHGGLYIYIHVNMFYLFLFINTDTLEQCI